MSDGAVFFRSSRAFFAVCSVVLRSPSPDRALPMSEFWRSRAVLQNSLLLSPENDGVVVLPKLLLEPVVALDDAAVVALDEAAVVVAVADPEAEVAVTDLLSPPHPAMSRTEKAAAAVTTGIFIWA